MRSTAVIKVAAVAQFTVYLYMCTLHKTVLKCTDSEQMLRWMIEGVSRLNRIRNADQKGRLNHDGSLNYVRRWQEAEVVDEQRESDKVYDPR